ncbi:DUF222 domain-containing protein [Microbacterium thalassium]|uniref:DUF222 domain-containing protein n=1 Tax=Microbacterium thalassium TaxID=362649 RepID=A0A7X0FPB2_9MICO|nr:DUF222 domain-containing protein [Microbacterium thalassium]MBB6391101.1 hypothetical protein [Microbacterium thalassium]GLK23789.1 hypothetical protein GCM10017607_11070 [Microbacterium thalassium]
MLIFTDLEAAIGRVRATFGEDVDVAGVPARVVGLGADAAVEMMTDVTEAIRSLELLRTTAAGVVAAASTRDRGHAGAAQTRGHRTPESLVQEITGSTRAEATKAVRVGESLVLGAAAESAGSDEPQTTGGEQDVDALIARQTEDPQTARTWRAPADDALITGTITNAQHDAIVRGLGAPVESSADDAREAWSLAVERLVAEAPNRTIEELAKAARSIRDILDPEGAQRRFDERNTGRSFRLYTDSDGVRRASIAFDDEGGAWAAAILDAGLRPRRGGPRFVDAEEKSRADDLVADPRTNEQLAYDLFIDVLRAGALADAKQVFGTRQAGVRMVIMAESVESPAAVGHLEEDGATLPAWLVARRGCDLGYTEVITDSGGNPLYLGRESRLFSAKQRIALAVRDGGCRWRSCDRPASYCEAPHRRMGRRRREDRRRSRNPALSLPSHGSAPRRVADHPQRWR